MLKLPILFRGALKCLVGLIKRVMNGSGVHHTICLLIKFQNNIVHLFNPTLSSRLVFLCSNGLVRGLGLMNKTKSDIGKGSKKKKKGFLSLLLLTPPP